VTWPVVDDPVVVAVVDELLAVDWVVLWSEVVLAVLAVVGWLVSVLDGPIVAGASTVVSVGSWPSSLSSLLTNRMTSRAIRATAAPISRMM